MINDEALQNEVQRGAPSGETNPDLLAYAKVFDVLNNQKQAYLKPGFSNRVVSMIQARAERKAKTSVWEYVMMFGGGMFLLVAFVILLIATQFKFEFGFLKAVSNFRGLFVFGIIFILVLHWLDKKITPRKEVI